jgi:hypothetical protein
MLNKVLYPLNFESLEKLYHRGRKAIIFAVSVSVARQMLELFISQLVIINRSWVSHEIQDYEDLEVNILRINSLVYGLIFKTINS